MFFLNFLLGSGFRMSLGIGAMGNIWDCGSLFSHPVLSCVDHSSHPSSSLLLLLFSYWFNFSVWQYYPVPAACQALFRSSLLSWNLPSCEKGEQETTKTRETIRYEYAQTANSERSVHDCGGGWRPLTSWGQMELFLPSWAFSPWFCPWCLVPWLHSQLSCTQSWSQCHIIPPLRDLPDTDGLSFPNVLSLSYFLIH